MSIRTLLTTDGSEPSRKTARFLTRLSRHIPLEVGLAYALDLHTLDYKMIPDFQVEMIREGAKRAAEALLQREVDYLRDFGLVAQPRLLVGDAGAAICEYAQREKVALVVCGRRGHGDLQDILFGSVSSHVVHHCGTPVLVVKQEGSRGEITEEGKRFRVLVPLDDSEASRRCLDFLVGLGPDAADGLELCLMHVVNPTRPGFEHLPDGDRYEALRLLHARGEELASAGALRLQEAGFTVAARVEEGSAGRTICRVLQEDGFDFVVLGRRGAGEIRETLFGSVCHYVLHHCPGHVLIVP